MTFESTMESVTDPWVGDHPAFVAHMNMLQSTVTRLATSSASCKTWCMTLVTALLSLAGSTHAPQMLPLALVPVVAFAFLDANYLSQERWFRRQFMVLATKAQENRYGRGDLFAIRSRTLGESLAGLATAFTSWAIWPAYGGIVAAYVWAWHNGLLALLASAPTPTK